MLVLIVQIVASRVGRLLGDRWKSRNTSVVVGSATTRTASRASTRRAALVGSFAASDYQRRIPTLPDGPGSPVGRFGDVA